LPSASSPTLRLYVDEDTASLQLSARLRAAGHVVIEPLRGVSDVRCWRHAQAKRSVVLTTNARDFVALAGSEAHHGLLLVYRENDPTRDMAAKEIAAAVDRVAETYPDGISSQILTLNGFRW
jgi:predicted nuclease of predicted toxin-antitoxin system